MEEDGYFPKISIVPDHDHQTMNLYKEIIHKILHCALPKGFFQHKDFDAELPLLKKIIHSNSRSLSLYLFGKSQKHALKFFIEMLSNWLVPGRRLNLTTVFSAEFNIPETGTATYIICEVIIQILSSEDLEKIINNFPVIKSEICLGLHSTLYAKRILEVKGLTTDAKTAVIQDNIAYLLERKPQYFDYNLLTEMQHVLVTCREEFRAERNCRHLSRMIGVQYLFRKSLVAKLQVVNKRHILLKIFRSEIKTRNQKKNVLSIQVGFNFLREKEIFEKRHLTRAIQNHIPNAVIVENSFFEDRRSPEPFCTIYAEIEKSDEEKFDNEEITRLRTSLPIDLLEGIEQQVHSVFMPRNEEEVMRNILSLSSEVKNNRDLPQVMITFDEQTYSKLSFTVIMVKISKPGEESIQQLFRKSDSQMDYAHDRCKTVGYLRDKYTKEATVFSLKLKKEDFIRRDHSLDINKARQAVVFELLRIIGEFRDFNGGMIFKQNELLSEVKLLLRDEAKFNDLLFENYFFSIQPTVMRTILEPEIIMNWYLLLQQTIEKTLELENDYLINIQIQERCVFLLIKSEQRFNRDEVSRSLANLQAKASEIATCCVNVHDVNYNGYIFRSAEPERQQEFISLVKEAVLQMFSCKKTIEQWV